MAMVLILTLTYISFKKWHY